MYVQSAIRRDETILRLGGDGYIAAMTWTTDDRQLVALIDGPGWPRDGGETYSSRLFALSGLASNAQVDDVTGYPSITNWEYVQDAITLYFGLSVLAVDEHIYQFLGTHDRKFSISQYRPTKPKEDPNLTNAKLIHSPDKGRTWFNQDGSTPVVLKQRQSRDNMMFYQERDGAFSFLSFLQMGKGYSENRDGYVYGYSPNGTSEGSMNELVMLRVAKNAVLDRDGYSYFAGRGTGGATEWTPNIEARVPVITFPSGWVPTPLAMAWLPSVVYNAPLGIYMMANCSGIRADCLSEHATYLGFWIADHPWGPWRQIHEEKAWTPGGDLAARACAPQIAPKWIAQDGKSFWLVWTDIQKTTTEDVDTPLFNFTPRTVDEWIRVRRRWGYFHPYFGFNCQRVDLTVA